MITLCLTVNVMSRFACFPRVASEASATSQERIRDVCIYFRYGEEVFFFYIIKAFIEMHKNIDYLTRRYFSVFEQSSCSC